MNDLNNGNPSSSEPPKASFPQHARKGSAGNHRTHRLTPILKPWRHKHRKAIDTRFREGKEKVAFRQSLIEMKGGLDNILNAFNEGNGEGF